MKKLIPADEFCASHNVEISFIGLLQETGLIEITTIQETGYIHVSQLEQIEKIIRLYYELDINLEGIDTITHLLQRIVDMQDEITTLKNRLRLYENL
ncbi:chaperone modulator CbpM [Williamwhitmania taraxaci]|uniref:MerR HTH family regulatory protein n=1 Tax=Williamwhitmania taraxaci TaxID=1640674 RepID=A0A1G6QRA9_9BACT|nr:chaperone modulator CbpM [Williamwhitmania taraxaci]SDC94237.1 MerR HTH family regulatory protein [Williamwhitmania taraxaci]